MNEFYCPACGAEDDAPEGSTPGGDCPDGDPHDWRPGRDGG